MVVRALVKSGAKTAAKTAKRSVQTAAYCAGQATRVVWHTGHYAAGRRMMPPLTAPGAAPRALQYPNLDRKRLRAAFDELFRKDWKNVVDGVYRFPQELRGFTPPQKILRESVDYLRDAREVARRQFRRGHSEVRGRVNRETELPNYYTQNFHFQTDGWLSDQSAARYEMQVETLFTGTGYAMRRLALPAILRHVRSLDHPTKLLDLGCGTGCLLGEVLANAPDIEATALDLSDAYLNQAKKNLRAKKVSYVAANAEETGLESTSFDVVMAVFLFHELPPKARKQVIDEAARLLKPGGIFVLLDTIQYDDDPGLNYLLENFPHSFHEPYYDGYCRENLAELFVPAGFVPGPEEAGFLSKANIFTRA